MSSLGPLVPADETFNHQITDTFASVAQSDRSWTEKVCAMACARDGSLQLALGLGKYTNRGVMDAYAGVSRGVEQWTVRASRALHPDVDSGVVGPIEYEVLEPLRRVRFALRPNPIVPVSFEWIFDAVVPPFLEDREVHRGGASGRVDADIVRYHHSGTARGWVEVEGRRVELDAATWVSTRDHSWGVRYMVGQPVRDAAPAPSTERVSASLVVWCPVVCERADGSRYALHVFYQRRSSAGRTRVSLQGGIEHPDGSHEPFTAVEPQLRFRDDTRRLLGGELRCVTAAGGVRVLTVTPVSDTGFHLGPGLYFGFDGHWHGEWRGPLSVDGEHIPDCTAPDVLRRIHQHRDCVVRVDDPAGGGTGWGNLQSIVTGAHPDMGLTAEASFL